MSNSLATVGKSKLADSSQTATRDEYSHATHSQYTKGLLLWIMTQSESVSTSPLTLPQSLERNSDSSQSTEHEEYRHIGRRLVDSNWRAAYFDALGRTSRDVNVIISSSVVSNELDALGQSLDELGVEWAGHAGALVGAVDDLDIIVFAAGNVGKKL